MIDRVSSQIPIVNDLLGGGWVPGCVYRISGAPGSGKSTFALDVAGRCFAAYAVAEESASAVRVRFDRMFPNASESNLVIGEVSSVEEITDFSKDIRFIVVDSLHRLRSPAVAGVAGSNTQLIHATEQLVALARRRALIVLAISHVNREGDASGTTGVDHDVDALLEIVRAPDNHGAARLRVLKNRHGPAPVSINVRLHQNGLSYGDDEQANALP
jgi:DNA repair protein RadA/Sms